MSNGSKTKVVKPHYRKMKTKGGSTIRKVKEYKRKK